MTAVAALLAPLAPEPDEARSWLERELADAAYTAAEPTVWDRAARAVGDFFVRLLSSDLSAALGPVAAVIATAVVVAVVVVALLVWGRPRGRARSHAAAGAVFSGDDGRSASELRRDAASAAARGEWDAAIAARFRALARALADRALVAPSPGATAQLFAREAARAFPAAGDDLAAAARAFDDVRYLRRPGSEGLYRRVADLDDALAATRPDLAMSAV